MGRSTTGVWAVKHKDLLIGPFDGRTPALAYKNKLVALGYEAKLVPLVKPRKVDEYLQLRYSD